MRPMVNNALRGLMKEVQLDKFQTRFGEILAYLSRTGRTPSWASLANRGAILDTTMISERFHLRLKDEFLHRNANSRLDGFVDLLIKSVEDLSESIEEKDRRRFADSAYRLKETYKRHRTAVTLHGKNPEMVVNITEDNDMRRAMYMSRHEQYTLSTCGVCAYAWSCTCMENRSGISCPHRHAVKMVTRGKSRKHQPQLRQKKWFLLIRSLSMSPQQWHRNAVKHVTKLSAIKSAYAVLEATATSLAKHDTDEAMEQLEEILCYIQLAAGVAQSSSSGTVAVRPELAQAGGKPQLAKIQLHQ
ncbi:hypothetical protein OSTOST_01712, partial [Ostertagia ostertagi]